MLESLYICNYMQILGSNSVTSSLAYVLRLTLSLSLCATLLIVGAAQGTLMANPPTVQMPVIPEEHEEETDPIEDDELNHIVYAPVLPFGESLLAIGEEEITEHSRLFLQAGPEIPLPPPEC
ncbi:MAG: hypothetical protein GYB31_00325 [Bacteroidetes bacterium]|nr:hypothetical protein [Bacteroidota bacterium]